MATDTSLTCRDCGQSFIFTSGEQEFFASRGLDNSPTRCPDCRAARKAERSGNGSSSPYGNGATGREREMFTATCSTCGKDAVVPFRPSAEKPVYCSDCFRLRQGPATPRSYVRY
jgi:CxxC-x17-CxxC domain-containing protein